MVAGPEKTAEVVEMTLAPPDTAAEQALLLTWLTRLLPAIADVAATVGISRRFVYKWVQRFLHQGLEGLADQPGRGAHRVSRQPALTAQHDRSA
ncbi:MAG: hypothetical protein AUG75_19645 [Cyanobacteria bacterium 13_1_20CM_4_61_6]|nr:MAG: hypothetical protein AUG75_19645 [Cyanobacteria bacterium 13_1_20CM_4_61_6]